MADGFTWQVGHALKPGLCPNKSTARGIIDSLTHKLAAAHERVIGDGTAIWFDNLDGGKPERPNSIFF
jgi:hypothetical protein